MNCRDSHFRKLGVISSVPDAAGGFFDTVDTCHPNWMEWWLCQAPRGARHADLLAWAIIGGLVQKLECTSWKPGCEDKECGGDCGQCGPDQVCAPVAGGGTKCVEQAVACLPQCNGKSCGSDGCGGSCGTCSSEEGYVCVSDNCVKCGGNWAQAGQWTVANGECKSACIVESSDCAFAATGDEHLDCAFGILKYLLQTNQFDGLQQAYQEAAATLGGVDGLTVFMGPITSGPWPKLLAIKFTNPYGTAFKHKTLYVGGWNDCIAAYRSHAIQAYAAYSDTGSENGPWAAAFDQWLKAKNSEGKYIHLY